MAPAKLLATAAAVALAPLLAKSEPCIMEGYVYKSSPDVIKALRAISPQGAYVATAEACQQSCALSVYPPCSYFDFHAEKAPAGACWFLPANATLIKKSGWTAGPAKCLDNTTGGSEMWAAANASAASPAPEAAEAAADLAAAEAANNSKAEEAAVAAGEAAETAEAATEEPPLPKAVEAAAPGGMPQWLPAAAILCIISALIAAAVAYFSCFKQQKNKKSKKTRGLKKEMAKPAYTPVPDGSAGEDTASLLAAEAPTPMMSYTQPAAMPMLAPQMQMQELLPTVAAPMPMYSSAPQYSAPVQMMAAPPMMMAQPAQPMQPVPMAQPQMLQQMPMTQPAPMGSQAATGQQIFDMLDRNHDGVLSRQEWAQAVQSQPQYAQQVEPMQPVRYA